jgi:hypothetical protein
MNEIKIFFVNYWKHQKRKQKSMKYIKIEQIWRNMPRSFMNFHKILLNFKKFC